MLVLSDAQLIQKFFPRYGISWRAFSTGTATRAGPAEDRAGINVFTTYPGPLKSNTATWGEDEVPHHSNDRFTKDAVEAVVYENAVQNTADPIPTVLYAGRSTARTLADRLGDYVAGRSTRCKASLLYLMENHPDRIFVRWTNAFHWETSLIKRYDPEFNTGQKNTDIEVGSTSFRWRGRITWLECCRDLGQVTSGPGLYAFTKPLGNERLAKGQVYYIGEAGNLRNRMRTYASGRAPSRKGANFVEELLNALPHNRIYVRWVQNSIFENEIIRILKPCFNASSTSFEWDED